MILKNNLKLTEEDSMKDVAMKMSEGNPGALQVVMKLLSNPGDLMYILACDKIGLYGSRLYMLWNDCCDRDIEAFKSVLRGWTSGKYSTDEILDHVSGGYGRLFSEE